MNPQSKPLSLLMSANCSTAHPISNDTIVSKLRREKKKNSVPGATHGNLSPHGKLETTIVATNFLQSSRDSLLILFLSPCAWWEKASYDHTHEKNRYSIHGDSLLILFLSHAPQADERSHLYSWSMIMNRYCMNTNSVNAVKRNNQDPWECPCLNTHISEISRFLTGPFLAIFFPGKRIWFPNWVIFNRTWTRICLFFSLSPLDAHTGIWHTQSSFFYLLFVRGIIDWIWLQ